jgi:hypothetical protein
VLGWGSRGQEDGAAQQIEAGSAVHGTLEGLDAVHLSLDRACGSWQLQRILDGGRIAFQTLGEARQRRCGHLLQHGGQLARVLLAQEDGQAPDRGRGCPQIRQLREQTVAEKAVRS